MGKIADLADSLLTTAVATLTQPAPDRQYVSQGEPPMDCAQVTVHLVRLRPKLLDPGSGKCMLVWVAGFQIVLVRCALTPTDDGSLPSGTELHAQNMALAEDGWDLASGLSAAWAAGNWPGEGRCQAVTFGPLEPFTPPVQGGLTGWRMTIEVELL